MIALLPSVMSAIAAPPIAEEAEVSDFSLEELLDALMEVIEDPVAEPSPDLPVELMPVPKPTQGTPPGWWPSVPEGAANTPTETLVEIPVDASPEIGIADASPPDPTSPPETKDPLQLPDLPPPERGMPVEAAKNDDKPPVVETLPRRSAAPIMQAVAEAAGRPAAPETGDDLGRLQVMLHRDGEHMHITILAERPETLEMMRRHADQLQLELQQEGFAQTDLSFAEWDGPEEDAQTAPAAAAPEPIIFNLPAPSATSGLDIRI